MPVDNKGKWQMSGLRPGSDGKLPKMEGKEPKKPAETRAAMPESGGKTMTVHDHGDGTFHTEHSDGMKEEHPDHLHMTTHIAHHAAPEMKHHHTSHDGFAVHTHSVNEAGEHQGTDEHESVEEAKDSLGSAMGEEGQEQAQPAQGESASFGGM